MSPLTKAVLLAVLAEGLLTLMDAMIKSTTARYPVLQVAFLRFACALFGAVLYLAWARPGWPSRDAVAYNAVRALFIVATATSFFYALSYLPLAEAIALSFISPVLLVVFGTMLLGEKIDTRIVAGLAGGLAGMMLIVSGKLGSKEFEGDALLGAGAVLVSAICYAATMALLRARAQRDKLAHIVFFQTVGPALVLAIPAYIVWSPLSANDTGLFLVIGTLGVTAHTLLAHAFRMAEAARLAPVVYVTLVWGIVFGYLFFKEVPTTTTLAGAAFIIAAAYAARSK